MKGKRFASLLLAIVLCVGMISATEAFAAVDSQAPVIDKESITISKETATVGDVVTISADVTDNVSIDRILVSLWNLDSEEQYNYLYMTQVGESDTYSCEFVVTEFTPSGTWTVRDISAYDTTSNVSSLESFDDTYSFEVIGTSPSTVIGTEDISIDKEDATIGETVTISIRVDGENVKHVSFDLHNTVSGKNLQFLEMAYDEVSERYIYQLTIDETIPSGFWNIGFINAIDAYDFGIAEFIGGTEIGFTVYGTTVDAEAPVVDNSTLTISPVEIQSGETSVISVKITDNNSVGDVCLSIRNIETGKLLAYPEMTYNSATDRYEFVLTADETIPSGHWRLCSIHAHDSADNLNLQSYYSWEYYILVKGENDHVWKTDAAEEPTCTRTGLTEGSSCSICGKINVAQASIPANGHSFTDYKSNNDATCTADSTKTAKCDNCDATDKVTDVGSKKGHDFNNNAEYCRNGCGTANPDYQAPSLRPSYKPGMNPTTPVIPVKPENPFVDVPDGKYFTDAVLWAVENGITGGRDATHFDPYASCTRGQLVTFLWRIAGEPTAKKGESFPDVTAGRYCEKAILWAAENGIIAGFADGTVKADAPLNRQQVAAILWRYAKYAGMDVSAGEDTNILSFHDALSVSEYAATAMQWAVGAGVLQGNDGNLMPTNTCTRAQIVTMLYRLLAK